MLENVEEFKTWGPVFIKNEKMYPDPVRAGETFIAFVRMLSTGIENDHPGFLEACEFLKISPYGEQAQRLLHGLGYEVDFKELRACDFGAPTIRKRFFLIARCDGKPIVWPKPTHGNQKGLQPYRTAADILDWSLPCPSIFESGEEIYAKHGIRAVRPLAENTLRRVARGLDKFVLNSAKPFIVQCKFNNSPESTEMPLRTITEVNSYAGRQ